MYMCASWCRVVPGSPRTGVPRLRAVRWVPHITPGPSGARPSLQPWHRLVLPGSRLIVLVVVSIYACFPWADTGEEFQAGFVPLEVALPLVASLFIRDRLEATHTGASSSPFQSLNSEHAVSGYGLCRAILLAGRGSSPLSSQDFHFLMVRDAEMPWMW